jgi:quinol monooxygenase YgiN
LLIDQAVQEARMIVVVGRVRADPEKRGELIEIGQRVAVASRQEAGCINYALHQDSEDENAFVFVEEWESETALREHFATPHIARFMASIPQVIVAEPDVQFHTVVSTLTLAEVSGR